MDWGSLIIAIITSLLCIALATGRGRLHPALALQAGGTSARERAVQRWKRATEYVLRVLRLRLRLGRWLHFSYESPRHQDLVEGLSRRTGPLTRIYDASLVEHYYYAPQAKTRIQPNRRICLAALTDSD